MPFVPEAQREILFQIRQQFDEDDLDAFQEVERKRNRPLIAKSAYIRFSALVTGVGIIVGSAFGLWQAFLHLHGPPGSIILLLAVMGWTAFVIPSIGLLFRVAFVDVEVKLSQKAGVFTMTFCEDGFYTNDGQNESYSGYASISKYVEGKEHFFLYFSARSCIPIRRTCFVVGTPEDFSPFMREKYRTKDM